MCVNMCVFICVHLSDERKKEMLREEEDRVRVGKTGYYNSCYENAEVRN